MARDPRFDILFEPVRIGPVIAPNRFYQVPHCTGMGWARPRTLAEMRSVKAQGGWGVVCTEYCSIHPASDDQTYISASLWDQSDVHAHRLMTDKVHEHGSLAGVELWFGGHRPANLGTRLPPMDVTAMPNSVGNPFQSRAMDKADIRDFRRWHRKAALRAREAEFDIVYVYASHHYLIANFLNPLINTRTDEYGGSLENRTRLMREVIEDTKEAVGDRCAIAVRFAADETAAGNAGPELGERRDMFAMMADMPDLWDINVFDYDLEMATARFAQEGALEPYMNWVRSLTTKPVVTVGRYTSPESMLRLVKSGVADFVGAARPSIADPYLPAKIAVGRFNDIRECIGCNVCYSGDSLAVPIRCTQNPTMGEEWRRGWHPDRVEPCKSEAMVLVVGAGPAGMEAARVLGERGYSVALAEAGRILGGRVVREASLPGMHEYIRVRDWCEHQLAKLPNVKIFRESRMTAADIIEFGADHVVIATGAKWRPDVFNGSRFVPVAGPDIKVFTPDDIMDGNLPSGRVLLFDSDSYYMGGVIAEKLICSGLDVTLVTPSDSISAWTLNTGENALVSARLINLGIKVITMNELRWFDGSLATIACKFTGREQAIEADSLVVVSARTPVDSLYGVLRYGADGDEAELPFTLDRIGDCNAPAIIAAAIYAGYRYAAELDAGIDPDQPVRQEKIDVAHEPPSPFRDTASMGQGRFRDREPGTDPAGSPQLRHREP